MPGFLGGSTGGSSGTGGEISFPKEFIDPVTKLRVSQPENLIDTDFEYGLQPTKWETVELINNTPSFFSKSGDTTIPNIVSITTNAGTREITVVCALEHGVSVGIPIQVTGTKSVTADGSYIINSIPNTTTFTYLCKANQPTTSSIEDLYSSIITGEFFQGSQLRVADASGIVTNNAEGTSTLTVTTESAHGFKSNTPFYFLNLNSTISKDFQASNTAAKSFDSTNSAVAQTFDGSNTLSSINVDWSNSATVGGVVSTISAVSTINNTITVAHSTESFASQPLGTPLYYAVTGGSGYFATNPRGVIFLKSTTNLGASTSTFQVSAVPDGDVIPITAALSGTFQLANQARTFAGNNRNASTEISLTVIKDGEFAFDGGNQGYAGTFVTNGLSTVEGYSGTILVSVTAGAGLDYYPGAMVRYNSTGAAATGLTNNATYFINTVVASAIPNLYNITIRPLPSSANITPSGGTGTQTFQKIGVSTDRDIVHIKDANFAEKEMIEYTFPEGGRFGTATTEESKIFYFVAKAYDAHNYELNEALFTATAATGGLISTHTAYGITYRTHTFTTVGSNTFAVSAVGTEPGARFIMVGGGGSGGARHGGGGGAGGFVEGTLTLSATSYPIVIGAGGTGKFADQQGNDGASTTFNGLTALGGGGGGAWGDRNGRAGGSGGGGSEVLPGAGGAANQPGSASGGFGSAGASSQTNGTGHGSGGGGAGEAGVRGWDFHAGPGGAGRRSTILGTTLYFAGGGGAGSWESGDMRRGGNGGFGGAGGGGQARSGNFGRGGVMSLNAGGNGTIGIPNSTGGDAAANTGGGGGGGGAYPPNTGYESTRGGNGGSGVVIIRYPITQVTPITYTSATGGTLTTHTETGITYNVHTFTTVGLNTFVVNTLGTNPEIEIFAYGAAGGGANPGGWTSGAYGGAGGFANGRHALTSPKTYAVMVGGGGANPGGSNNGVASTSFTAGGGAPSKADSGDNRYNGQGGGLSGVFDNNTYNVANAILIAGGGGGGGASRASLGNQGGAGGGLTGEDGFAFYDGQTARRGRGGAQSGPTALPTDGNSTAPTQLAGGVSINYGGGGGGGWWGGSAGTYTESNTMGGGGGGSAYFHPTKITNGVAEVGAGPYPPAAGFRGVSSQSVAGTTNFAVGGGVNTPGGNGIVVIRYPIAITAV
jgi:hypothetical protein